MQRKSAPALPGMEPSGHGTSKKLWQEKVHRNIPKLEELRRSSLFSTLVKVDPNVRSVSKDCSHVGEFQKLLATFKEPQDETLTTTFATLNSKLQMIIEGIVGHEEGLTDARIARQVSMDMVALLVHGIIDVAAVIDSTSQKDLLVDLGQRLLHIDHFVRRYFVDETAELEQILATLEDSLQQEHTLVKRLQDELKTTLQSHKRKSAELQLFHVIQQAKLGKNDFRQNQLNDGDMNLTLTEEEMYETNARLTKELTELKGVQATTRIQLDSALREVVVLKNDVEALRAPIFRDREVKTLQDELFCERKRVKALEIEVQDLRLKLAEFASATLRNKTSHVQKFRHAVQQPSADSTNGEGEDGEEVIEMSPNRNEIIYDKSNEEEAMRHQTFLVMLNYDLGARDSMQTKNAIGVVAGVAQAAVKLKTKVNHKSYRLESVPSDLISLRIQMNGIYERKRLSDEHATMMHVPKPSFIEVILSCFVSKSSTLKHAEAEARGFLDGLMKYRTICGHVRLFEEFAHGKHDDEVIGFYLWVAKSLDTIHIGPPFPTSPEIHPQYICKYKVSLVNRTIYRVLHFHSCGVEQGDRIIDECLDIADKILEGQRIFSKAAAAGPMYLGEFHAVLDKFLVQINEIECYQLDLYLYLLVLLFKKQRDWHLESAIRLFNQVAQDFKRKDIRRKTTPESNLEATATTNEKGKKTVKKSPMKGKSNKRKRAIESGPPVMNKDAFGALLAKLDIILPHSEIQELTIKVLCFRQQYASGITSEAFSYTASKLGWFRKDFTTRLTLLDELQVSASDTEVAVKQIHTTWDLHVARLCIYFERDRNPFVSRSILQLRNRITSALRVDPPNPMLILSHIRALLHLVWDLAVLRSVAARSIDDEIESPASIIDIARSVELILIAKGISAIPEVIPGPQAFNSNLQTTEDELIDFSQVQLDSIRDLLSSQPAIQTTKCIEINRILARRSWYLADIYHFYSLIRDTEMAFTMDALQELAHDIGIISTNFTIVHLNTIFQKMATKRQQADRIDCADFLELAIRLAVQKHACEEVPDKQQQHLDENRVSLQFDHFITNFIIPHQIKSNGFRQEIASPDIQRLLLCHRNFLRRIFLHYAKQDHHDEERSKMNFYEFESFLDDFQLNDGHLFPKELNKRVFYCVQDDMEQQQFIYHEFTTAIIAIGQYKYNDPFHVWRYKTELLINYLIVYAMDHHTHFRSILG